MTMVDKIKKLCGLRGMSIPDLESILGLGNGAIYKWHKSSPKVDTLLKVAMYFNVTLDSLISDPVIIEKRPTIKSYESCDESYIELASKAQEKGIPLDTLSMLIDLYTK